jgi:hypothetical protein
VSRPTGSLFAAADPAARRLAGAIAWLWRLGPALDAPRAGAVGIGGGADQAELARLVESGRLAGGVVLAPGLAPEEAERAAAAGLLRIGTDPDTEWGRFGVHRLLEAVSEYLVARLDRPLVLLPRIGMLRIDDLPGTAQHQLEGRAKTDRRQRRRLRRYVRACRRAGAVLNAAVPAEAFRGEERVPLDEVWPGSVSVLRGGVAQGAVEPVCHGLLHLDTERLEHGAVEFREFAHLSEDEAGSRIDASREWQARVLGKAGTFVAPAWAYSEGALAAAASRGIPCFTRCEPGATYAPGLISETLKGGLGIEGLDYRPLSRMAAAGLPPTMVLHGTMIDVRAGSFSLPADLITAARLFLRRDLSRLPSVAGLRWLGASAYAEALARHDRIVVEGSEVRLPPGSQARVLDHSGERQVKGSS